MSTTDLITLFVAPLNRVDLPYMATGSVAAMIYGEPRLTNDIDLVVDLHPGDAIRFCSAYDHESLYVPPAEAVEAEASRESGGHFNVIHGASALKADVYVAGRDPVHRWALDRRRSVPVANERLWVAPPEYVIVRKLQYFSLGKSDKHLRDVKRILAVSGPTIDLTAVSKWCEMLGAAESWASLMKSSPPSR